MKITSLIKTSIALATTALAATPAFAQSANWTGAYLGAEVGGANYQLSIPGASIDNDGIIGGLILGYDYDLGTVVIGAGADIDFTDISLFGTADLDRIWRLKLRGGYKIGNGLLYATGGYANIDINGIPSEDGYFIGGGYEYLTKSNFSIGGEVLYNRADNIAGSNLDAEVITYQIRGAYRF